MNVSTLHQFRFTCNFCKRLASVIVGIIYFHCIVLSQPDSGKLLKCTWQNSSLFNFYKKESVYIKIKSAREYKPWERHSNKKLVLEEVQNENLLASLENGNKIVIPISSIESIQLINGDRKIKNNPIKTLGIFVLLGLGFLFLRRTRIVEPGWLFIPDVEVKGCITFLFGFLTLLGLWILISGQISPSKYEKIGPEIRLEEPGCHCEWQTKP